MIEGVPVAEKFVIFLESSPFSTQALAGGCHVVLWAWGPGALAEAFTFKATETEDTEALCSHTEGEQRSPEPACCSPNWDAEGQGPL